MGLLTNLSHLALPTSWEKPLPDVSASPGALGLSAPTLPVTEALSLPQVATVYRQKLAQVHDDLEQLRAFTNSGAGHRSSGFTAFVEQRRHAIGRAGIRIRDGKGCFLFYSEGDKKDAEMDNFLKKDASESEAEAADLFEDSVARERHAALAVSKGKALEAKKDYAQVVQNEEEMEKLMTRAAEDAEEDAMLVKQHDDRGRDVDALPYTDDDPVEHTE